MTTAHLCPVPGCGAPLKRGHLMCRPCWALVPRKLQTAVNRTWRAFQGRRTGADPLALLADYRKASDQAVKAAEERR